MKCRLAVGLEYDGSDFAGWQSQVGVRSVQQVLGEAIGRVANHPVSLASAGRTDAGVHATAQVVHFDTMADRTPRSWLLGINSNLPADVVATWVCPVAGDFHARYSALARRYRYLIVNRPVRAALERQRCWHVRPPLDLAAMNAAAALLLGEHDFSAFRGAGCQARSPVRRLDELVATGHASGIAVDCMATGFLYHMVRNIVGALVHVGRGEADAAWLGRLLAGRDRRLGAVTAPAAGLYLAGVYYPAGSGVPPPPPMPSCR